MSAATEKMPVFCPNCSRKLMVPVTSAGKMGRCPSCSHVFPVTAPLAAEVLEELPDLTPLPDEPAFLSSDPFAANVSTSGYTLQPVATTAYASAASSTVPAAAAFQVPNPYAPAAAPTKNYNHGFGLEQKAWDMGMLGGLLMMAIGGIWFFAGLAFGLIFYYAPILFLIGLVGFVRGLFTGNVSGQR